MPLADSMSLAGCAVCQDILTPCDPIMGSVCVCARACVCVCVCMS